ncbi:MAG: GvpL/GvpF family gas vesicle protein [Gemmatimonadaceae bacterium]
MPTYLYCVIPAGYEPPAATAVGVERAPVRALSSDELDAWVSTVPDASIPGTLANARAHDGVVRAAMSRATPVPARLGQVVAHDDDLRRWMRERQRALIQSSERVRGCVEMTVRVLMSGGDPAAGVRQGGEPPRDSGRAYLDWLRARQQALRDAERQARRLHEEIARLTSGVIRETAGVSVHAVAPLLEVAHLVPRDLIARHRDIVHAVVEGRWGLRLMLTGPWAPYTFCTAASE